MSRPHDLHTDSYKELQHTIGAGRAILQHANLGAAATWLECRLSKSPAELETALALATKTQVLILGARQHTIKTFRERKIDWSAEFKELAELEKAVVPAINSSSELEDDTIAQLSFTHPLLQPFNHIPWILTALTLFKVWVVPGMALLTPLFAWILPYILLKFVYALPINHEQYGAILQGMVSGNMMETVETMARNGGKLAGPLPALPSFWNARSIGQMALFGFSFLQGLIQPIQNAMHLYKTDRVVCELGGKLLRIRDIVRKFREDMGGLNGKHVKLSRSLEGLVEGDPRASFSLVKEQPERLHIIMTDLARLEVIWRISQKESLQLVTFAEETFGFYDVVDISLEAAGGSGGAVPSSFQLKATEATHAVITGPNGGGKSSFLRAVLQSVLFGRAYGYAPAKLAVMPYFKWIASGLQLRDSPGVLSMFETEVKFAADTLALARSEGNGLVLFDELFHSTNPPDGVRTAKEFLHRLWNSKQSGMFSIVSTHVFPLIEKAPANVVPICCPAERGPDGNIRYTYKVEPGICRVSSVDKVWGRFGLLR